jgi:hypothetical protein
MKTASAIAAIAALGILACNTEAPSPGGVTTDSLAQASAAIHALEQRDEASAAACDADVRTCFESIADGGSSGACEALREQCQEAKDALDDVRKPPVACWHQVEECARHGKGFAYGDAGAAPANDAGASCGVRPRDCQGMGHDADQDRNPILECRSEVRECLSSVWHRADDWRAECGDVRDACSSICGLAASAGREHGHGERAEGLRDRLRQLLDGMRQRRHGGHGSHGSHDDGADAGRD